MNYDTFFSLDLDLDDKAPPRVCTASGTDMGALGYTTFDFQINGHSFTQQFIVCRKQTRKLILGQDFAIRNRTSCRWTDNGTKILKARGKFIIEVEEPEASKYLPLRKSVRIPPRHYAVTHLYCKKPEGPISIKPDEAFRRGNPSAWTDTYYMDPHRASSDESTTSTADPAHEVPGTQKVRNDSFQDPKSSPMEAKSPSSGPLETAIRAKTLVSDDMDASRPSKDRLVKIPYVIYNLSVHEHVYIPKDTVVAYLDDEEPEMDCFEIAETFEEAQEAIQYRNHLPSRPNLRVPPESDMICSPAEVKFHRKVELKDHDATPETKQRFEDLCKDFPEVFSEHNEDIGRTNLITMDIDTGDSPPSAKKPYTLPLKHYEWVQQEIESLERAGVITRSVSPWASPVVVVPKKSAPGEAPRRRMCIDFRAINALQPTVVKADSKAKGNLTLHPLPNIDQLYAQLKGAKVFTTLDLRSGYYHIELGKSSRAKTAFVTPFGKYEFNMVPFGLAQAPAYFQALISKVLKGLHKFAMAYLDDIIIFSNSEEEHLEHLRIIFQRLKAAGLKLKSSKCDFMKRQIHYLGHLISEEGIQPLPEKLESIRNMPAPKNVREIKQFLGLAGYYRKFVPRFSDLSRPLTKLTRKDELFIWTKECEAVFQMLKDALCDPPILKYPDPNRKYILFTDASKYGWAGVLTQPYEEVDSSTSSTKEQSKIVHHPIAYVSGLFRGSQLNWAALTKEAYAIYLSVRKLSFYLTSADVLIRSDHLPLKKFLHQSTNNKKVDNWAVELESFNLQFQYIQGIKNTLADTLSRLIQLNPDVELPAEKPGQEFGHNFLEELPPVEVSEVIVEGLEIKPDPDTLHQTVELQLPLKTDKIRSLQRQDRKIKSIIERMQNSADYNNVYIIEDGILRRRLVEPTGNEFKPIVIPRCLVDHVLLTAHDYNGHNGFPRTYASVKRLYFWVGMKKDIHKHCKKCQLCAKHNIAKVKFEQTHFKGARQPMQFISMDLVGEFHPPSRQGHRYALTVICMHTSYVFCIPLKTKTAEEVVQAYMRHVYSKFGGSEKILSDNGTEFKNKLFEDVAKKLGVEYKIYTPPYRPQSNGKIEGFHRYLKSCIAKHIVNNMEWDEFTDLATAAYNFVPNVTAMESPFFLMFGRDPYMPLNQLLEQVKRYLGTDQGIPDLEALQNLLQMTTTQIKYASGKRNQNFKPVKPHEFKVGDLVLVRNHTSKAFQEKYQDSFRIVRLLGKNQLEVKNQKGHLRQVHITDVKKTSMPDVIINNVPDYTKFGRPAKLRLDPKHVEDLEWTIPTQFPAQETDVSEVSVDICQANLTDAHETKAEMTTGKSENIQTTPSWFWSITEKLKQGFRQRVNSVDIMAPLAISDQPL